jgi:branched-chain amino acid transport system substrate-binding protein
LDFTGPAKSYGQGESLGLQIAADELNKTGGILGHKVEIKMVNDQSNPTQGVSGLQQLLSSGVTPNLFWAGSSSTVTQAELPTLMSGKIISFDATSASNLNDPSMYPYYFATNQTVASSIPAFVTAAKQQGWSKVAMIYGNDVSGQASEKAYATALAAANIKLVSASYSDTALNMTPQLESLRSQNPSGLIVSGFGTAAIYVVKSRAQIGWNIPTYADFLASFQLYPMSLPASSLQNFKVEVQRSFLSGDPLAQDPVLQTMIADAKAASGGADVLKNTGASLLAPTYSALMMVNYAATQANSIAPDDLKNALEHLKTPPSPVPWVWYGDSDQIGNFNYSATNHYGTAEGTAFSYVAAGVYNADGLFQPSSGS